jgi:hypothetical protein
MSEIWRLGLYDQAQLEKFIETLFSG